MNILGLSFAQFLAEVEKQHGKGLYHARAAYRQVFRKGSKELSGLSEFQNVPELARNIEKQIRLPECRIVGQQESRVSKFVSAMEDGQVVETVIIPAAGRATLCVSCQVGCRMGCRFCATGRMGFVRSLRAEEIVWQVFAARFLLKRKIDNIVFMGMGEPLDNCEQVLQAVGVISEQRGLDIAPRHITISTAGHVDGIIQLEKAAIPNLRLAVSINTADDTLRNHLMPINRRYPLDRLKSALHGYCLQEGGVVFVEHVLLAGINDSLETADRLAGFLFDLPVRVNVIAYNGDGAAPFFAPPENRVRQFCKWLSEKGIFVRRRPSLGRSISAGCGQLAAKSFLEKRGE